MRVSLMKLERVSTQIDFPTEFAELCGTVSSFFDASELSFSELQQEFESAAQDEEGEGEGNEGDEEDAVITEITAESGEAKPAMKATAAAAAAAAKPEELSTPTKMGAKTTAKTGEKSARKRTDSIHDAENGNPAGNANANVGGEVKGLGHRSASKHENRSGNAREFDDVGSPIEEIQLWREGVEIVEIWELNEL